MVLDPGEKEEVKKGKGNYQEVATEYPIIIATITSIIYPISLLVLFIVSTSGLICLSLLKTRSFDCLLLRGFGCIFLSYLFL